jgi:sigma-E factor negative regulatory protein RseB
VARLAPALLLLATLAAQAGQPQPDALVWIQRMNEALSTRNYEGFFRHRFGERSEVLRIVHRVKDGQMTERVISTDGSGYEQKRQGPRWAEFLPEKKWVNVSTRYRSFGFIPMLNGLDEQVLRHYEASDGGTVRLVARDVRFIHVDPRDALRYGYRLWIDVETALPLKLQRTSFAGQVLKEIEFLAAPQLPESIPDDDLKVGVDYKDFRWMDRDAPMFNAELKRAYVPQAALLPAGYRVLTFGVAPRGAPAARTPAGHRARFIVSDGVSWADVYVRPAIGEFRTGGGPTGPLSGYQLRVDDVQVVVIGEMPLEAAKAIAEAVRPE